MAAKKGAVSKSAGLDELKADLKAETLKNAYIFYGEETYLRQSYLDQVREALVPAGFEEFNYHRLGGKGLSMQALQEAVEAMPMMAQHTMVVVTDLDIFKLDMSARGVEVALTGRAPSRKIVEKADYITEMRCKKHPYEQGICAREGVEY